ncbi:MAG: Ig-like domain-containing protein [Herbinix sp.]|nr:Ig-like domain-containing protein [Herbinix sp.]
MSHFKKIFFSFLLCITILSQSASSQTVYATSSDPFPFVILSQYEATADIGDDIYILAVTSNGKQATWKSSNSKVASVNTYGIITAKKAGSALITAKIKNAEASCYITVNKTKVIINASSAAIERGATYKLSASTSNDSEVTWKSSKKSIATVDEYGTVTGLKPGQTTITANADGTSTPCIITVKSPTVQLNKASIRLYRGGSMKLFATVSSKVTPTWKSNKKSVAIVDSTGTITAIKNGSATITATVDGVSAVCEVVVLKPDITLSITEITLKAGETTSLTATVSSGNLPSWSTSNSNVISINSKGEIKALQKGKAYIYASEDGTKARCTVRVTE